MCRTSAVSGCTPSPRVEPPLLLHPSREQRPLQEESAASSWVRTVRAHICARLLANVVVSLHVLAAARGPQVRREFRCRVSGGHRANRGRRSDARLQTAFVVARPAYAHMHGGTRTRLKTYFTHFPPMDLKRTTGDEGFIF